MTENPRNYVLHWSPQWCDSRQTGIPKEKLLRKRNSVNDTHMLDDDTENHRKQKKTNAVVNSKWSLLTFPGINILLTRKCWRDECDSWLFWTSHSGIFWKSLSLGCFLNTEGTNESYHLSICPEIPKQSMPPLFFFFTLSSLPLGDDIPLWYI